MWEQPPIVDGTCIELSAGPLQVRQWDGDEALLYHSPSSTTLQVSAPLACAVRLLQGGGQSLQRLSERVAHRFPDLDPDAIKEHLKTGFRQLCSLGIASCKET